MKTEEEVKEAVLRQIIQEKSDRLMEIADQIMSIGECRNYNLNDTPPYDTTKTAKEFLDWLEKVKTIALPDINAFIANNHIGHAANPEMSMRRVKNELETKESFLKIERDRLIQELPSIEDQAHRLKVDRLTLEYGKESLELGKAGLVFGKGSVDLTRINIKISLWIPIGIFVLTLIVGTFIEAFKPEILDWIRHLARMASLPR